MRTTSTSSSPIQTDLLNLQNLAEQTSNPYLLESLLRTALQKEAELRSKVLSTSDKAYTILSSGSLVSDKILKRIQHINSTQPSTINSTILPASTTIPPSIFPTTPYPYQSNLSITRGITTQAFKIEPRINAVGFTNLNNNCWCNSLLQMVIHIPSLRQAYTDVANYYANYGTTSAEQECGKALLQALSTYEFFLPRHVPINASVSQNVRVAFSTLFPADIDSDARCQEDVHEVMLLLMSRYEMLFGQKELPLYIPVETKKIYEPQGNPFPADPYTLVDDYTRLASDFSTSTIHSEYQIIFDVKGFSNPTFSQLLSSYFDTRDGGSGPSPTYLLPDDDLLQKFTLKQEIQKFQKTPQELFLTIARLGSNSGRRFKIMTPIAIPRSFELIQNGLKLTYDLDFFIIHRGDAYGGHYIAYRKIQEEWIRCNDAEVTRISQEEMDKILGHMAEPRATSYIHHYMLRSQEPVDMSSSSSSCLSYRAPLGLVNLDSARQSQIEAAKGSGPNEQDHCWNSKASEEDRFGKVAASPNSPNLTERGIVPPLSSIEDQNLGLIASELMARRELLEELKQLLNNRAATPGEIKQFMATLPPDLITIIDFLIWANGNAPEASNYGATIRQFNPRHINNIKLPWLSAQGQNLIQQLIALYDMKIQQLESTMDLGVVQKHILTSYLNSLKQSGKQITEAQLYLAYDQLGIKKSG